MALTVLANCSGGGGNGPTRLGSPEPVGEQSQAVLGATTFGPTCLANDIAHLQIAFEYARIAETSPAFAECLATAFNQAFSLNPPGDGQVNIGPHVACANDPPTPSSSTVVANLQDSNPTHIECDYTPSPSTNGGYAGVGGAPPSDPSAVEHIAVANVLQRITHTSAPCFLNPTLACASDVDYATIAGDIIHEILHQQGYDHPEFQNPYYTCGITSIPNPVYGNSVNYEVQECIRSVIDYSAANCSMHDPSCGNDGLNLQDSVFSPSPTCHCVQDPLGVQFPTGSVSGAPITALGLLSAGQAIMAGTSQNEVPSFGNAYTLSIDSGGNLVMQNGSGSTLAGPLTDQGVAKTLFMQDDGNLVLFDEMSAPIWASGTGGNPGANLFVQDDGNLIVMSPSNQVLWALSRSSFPATCGQIVAGEGLTDNDSAFSCDKHYRLVMQADGNLVLFGVNQGAPWSSNTGGQGGPLMTAEMDGNGNFVVVDYTRDPAVALWSTNTWGHPGASLAIGDDGSLAVHDAPPNQDTILWHN